MHRVVRMRMRNRGRYGNWVFEECMGIHVNMTIEWSAVGLKIR